MLKNILLGLFLVFSLHVSAFAEDSKQVEDDKVEKVFTKMARAYKGENIRVFFSHVSESKFQKDFLEYFDDVQEDLEKHNILTLDTWMDKITTDGKSRFLHITWTKRYLSTQNNTELTKDGKSVFLFVRTKKGYKLIDFGGSVLFGDIE